MTRLPAPAAELLSRATDQDKPSVAPDRYCADVTTDEARAFAEDLDDAGLDVAAEREYRLEYDFQAEHQAGVHLFFEPYLPHGEMICSPCG